MLLVFAAAVAALSCPVERAHYALRSDPTVTATFHPTAVNGDWPGGVTLRIHIGRAGHDYWWLPWNGGTDDMRHVRLTRRVGQASPSGDLRLGYDEDFWTTDAAYNMDASRAQGWRSGARPLPAADNGARPISRHPAHRYQWRRRVRPSLFRPDLMRRAQPASGRRTPRHRVISGG
jgi:hypothetical protein